MSFTLGSLTNIDGVTSYTGFDLPDDLQVVRLLSDGTTTHNAVAQGSGSSFPTAVIGGITDQSNTISGLRGYRASHELITFTDDQSESHTVLVSQLTTSQNKISGLWDWTATLLEVAAYVEPEA